MSFQNSIVLSLKTNNHFKKQILNSSVPFSEEEEEEDKNETTKAEEDFILNKIEHIFCSAIKPYSQIEYNSFFTSKRFSKINTPPPEIFYKL